MVARGESLKCLKYEEVISALKCLKLKVVASPSFSGFRSPLKEVPSSVVLVLAIYYFMVFKRKKKLSHFSQAPAD